VQQRSARQPSAPPPIPNLIAWVSVCLLAAAWGRGLDERWRPLWADSGASGLAAAIGLSHVRIRRDEQQRRKRDAHSRARVECGLDRFNQRSAAIDAIQAAVSRLVQFAEQSRAPRSDGTPSMPDRQTIDPLAGLRLEITPVDDVADTGTIAASHALPGTIQTLTSRTASFSHAAPFEGRHCLLTFDLGDTRRLSFVVDVLWTQSAAGHFTSSGSILAAGVPQDANCLPNGLGTEAF
jgi:hypothetical protein